MVNQIKIILIEDSPEYRNILVQAIQKESDIKLVGQFSTVETAQSSLLDMPPSDVPDIILLDLNLPGISGIEALPWFTANIPDTKVIVLTQSNREPDILNAISAGANGYLLKGSTRQLIFQTIRSVMAGGFTIDPRVASYILTTLKTKPTLSVPEIILSTRETEILNLLSEGFVQKQISDRLAISDHTVSTYIRRIYKKLEVQNAPAAISIGYQQGILPTEN